MQNRPNIFDWFFQRRHLSRWRRAARKAPDMSLTFLRRERARARQLRYALNDVISVADNRLALPMIGSTAFPKPHGTDWSWRPSLWNKQLDTPGMSSVESKSGLGGGLTLFHDCVTSELTLRQLRNNREEDLAPFALRMDVFNFDGSFLSLVLDLPEAAVVGLQRRHLLRMDAIVELEKPLEIFVRLNIKHGPNTEQIVRELPLNTRDCMIEFDLSNVNFNEKRLERMWIDLIFENPELNQVTMRDLTFSRYPRANL
jgi:hypothetical protein